jgi:hypothetical protein
MMALIDAGKPENSICKMVLIKNILDLDSQKIEYFWISYMQYIYFFALKAILLYFLISRRGLWYLQLFLLLSADTPAGYC